jgi:hypothetical protein
MNNNHVVVSTVNWEVLFWKNIQKKNKTRTVTF